MAGLNWVERAIEIFSPRVALNRAEARTRIARAGLTQAYYEAANIGRRTQGWRAVGTDANAETRFATGRVRDVARDMVRNNAYAARAKDVIANNTVGAGIMPKIVAANDARAKAVNALIKKHFESTDIDADGGQNIYGLQSLAMATIVESGEVIIRMRPRRSSDGYALPFQLQVLEPDYLDPFIEGPQPNGNNAIQGIEFDLTGKPVAYHLYDRHPGSLSAGASFQARGRRVSADFVAHAFRRARPGQVRGVSWFAPVMLRMRDWADFCDAQLMRQKIASCYTAFVTTSEGFIPGVNADGSPAITQTGIPIEQFEPGRIERLRDGESITFAQPPTVSDFGPYASATLREIAAGLGIPYEAMTGDLSNVNYSSGRMGWLEFQRAIESWRWNMLIPQMLDPIERWTQATVPMVTRSSEPFTFSWTPPRREMIDVETEINGAIKSIRGALSSQSEEIRKMGYDPDVVFAEIAADNKKMDALSIQSDSDPRAMTLRGVAQKSADPNAPDFGGRDGGGSTKAELVDFANELSDYVADSRRRLTKAWAEDTDRDEHGRWSGGGGGGRGNKPREERVRTFVSPNAGTLDFPHAAGALTGSAQIALAHMSTAIDTEIGIGHSSNANTIGAWKDGAENTLMSTMPGASFANAKVASAMKGYLANQKSVLVFEPGGGHHADFLARFDVDEADAGKLHEGLLKDGIAFHTLEPHEGDGATVHVFGSDQESLNAVRKVADKYGAVLKVKIGHGEFIGTALDETHTDDEQRADARRVYEKVIREASSAGGGGGRDIGKLWNDVRSRWDSLLSGLGSKAAVGVKAFGDDNAASLARQWGEASPLQDLHSIYEQAPANKKSLDTIGASIAASIEGVTYRPVGLKENGARLQQKIAAGRLPSQVKDIVRSSFIVDSPMAGDRVAAELAKDFEVVDGGWRFTDVKYGDRTVNMRFKNGQIGEAQILSPAMAHAKSEAGGGHALYVAMRNLDEGPELERLKDQSRDLYGAVSEASSPAWKAAFGIGGKSGKRARN